ncbi:MAG: PAS domain-containing protein [Caldilineaceae bacterium]|nr:PAS domain-containing protein [Caldilineaceae bacterium]
MSDAIRNFHIVGIGASAGGLEALLRFFSGTTRDVDMAFIVIQHLSPDYESHMVDLLSKQTVLPVTEATDGQLVEPNHIYLIPRRKNMTIFKGKLFLVNYDRSTGLNLPIDIFFESLAREQGDKAVGIVLSGTGSDGTLGIRAIKEAGGMVMVQDHTAKFDGMPRSAISTNLADYVDSPEQLLQGLLSLAKHQNPYNTAVSAPTGRAEQLDKLFAILHTYTKIDFSDYKPNTIIRRLERRMGLHQIEAYDDYIAYLENSPQEAQSLVKEFLIGVTRFFRDPEAFQIISEQIIPVIFAGKHGQEQVRIWMPGCATGEEAYSLAMAIQEYMEQQNRYLNVKILATDIDTDALEFAGRGIYSQTSLEDVSVERLATFFLQKDENRYEVTRNIRSMVVFARQNLIKDPPFAKIDLIVCRNLLIYFQPKLQQQILSIFQFALRPSGFLFLGSSESIGDFADAFTTISAKWKIYQYQGETARKLPILHWVAGANHPREQVSAEPQVWKERHQESDILRSLVEQAMPPCVVVDEEGMILHAFGDLDPFLVTPIGFRVTLNIRKMVSDMLAAPLSSALHRTFAKGESVHYRNLLGASTGDERAVHLSTRPFQDVASRKRFALITFATEEAPNVAPSEQFHLDQNTVQHIANLEQELQGTRENLQSTIEELETSNEELQATNEELLAANEELQSTNEELQSVNEELITVNTEYQMRIRELTQLNDDISNLFDSTPIGIIFLDADLNVRKFTPAVQQVVNLLEQDIGRPLHHLSHHLVGVDLTSEARCVLASQAKHTMDVRGEGEYWYRLEFSPYVTHAHHTAGVIVALTDISEQTHMQGQLANDQFKLKAALDTGGLAFWEMELATGRVTFSRRKAEILGYSPQCFNHYNDFTALVHSDDYETVMDAMRRHLQSQARVYEAEYRILAHDQSYHWFKDIGQVTRRDSNGAPLVVVGITTDTTHLHAGQAALVAAQLESRTLSGQIETVHRLMSAAGFALWHVDHGRGLVECSDALITRLGMTGQDANAYDAFVSAVHPDHREDLIRFITHGHRDESVLQMQFSLRCGDGYLPIEQYSRTHYSDDRATTSTAIVKLPA